MRSDRDDGRVAGGAPDWAALTPVGVVALGAPSRPIERLPQTQAAVYRLIVALGRIRLPRLRLAARAATREIGLANRRAAG